MVANNLRLTYLDIDYVTIDDTSVTIVDNGGGIMIVSDNAAGIALLSDADDNGVVINAGDAGVAIHTFIELDQVTEPAAGAAGKTRLYVRDDGGGNDQFCVRFDDGDIVPIATDAATLGPVAIGNQVAWDQTAYSTTLAVVPAEVNVGALVLLADVITAMGTFQTAINDNRKMINQLIDILQASLLAKAAP